MSHFATSLKEWREEESNLQSVHRAPPPFRTDDGSFGIFPVHTDWWLYRFAYLSKEVRERGVEPLRSKTTDPSSLRGYHYATPAK